MKTQAERLGKLLQRQRGATSMEIVMVIGSVSPHRRLTDLKEAGWTINKKPVIGKNYNRYFGIAPKVA